MNPVPSGSKCEIIDIMPYIKKHNNVKNENKPIKKEEVTLSEIVDVMVQLTIILDHLGEFKYADKLSDLVGEIFEDEGLNPK